MADRTVRGGPERSRIKTLTQAGLDHLDGTLGSLDDLAKRLIVLVEPVEAIVQRIDDMVKVGETVMSPLAVTEQAVRGVLDRLRNRTAH